MTDQPSLAEVVRAIAACVTDAVMIGDRDLRIVDVNAAAEELLGRPRCDLVGTPLPCPPRDAAARGVVVHPCATNGFRTGATIRSVDAGEHVVVVASPLDEPADAFARRRIADLEAGLKTIGWELQALGVGVGGPAPEGGAPVPALRDLSRREREVLDAFLSGTSVAQTAAQLHLSEHTVRSHLKAIYRKLGVRGQTELMRRLAVQRRPSEEVGRNTP